MSLLQLDRVTKRYVDGVEAIAVLEDVCLQVQAGEAVGIVGERRSGKTTLLRVAAGIEMADSGEVRFGGRVLGASTEQRAHLRRHRGVALVQGDWRPPAGTEVLALVATPLLAEGMSAHQAHRVAHETLERVGAGELAMRSTDALSVAECIRLDLARSLVSEPCLLLVDEPAVLPSPTDSRQLYALLRRLPGELGLALLIASEDIAALAGLPRMLSLSDGRLLSSQAVRRMVRQ